MHLERMSVRRENVDAVCPFFPTGRPGPFSDAFLFCFLWLVFHDWTSAHINQRGYISFFAGYAKLSELANGSAYAPYGTGIRPRKRPPRRSSLVAIGKASGDSLLFVIGTVAGYIFALVHRHLFPETVEVAPPDG